MTAALDYWQRHYADDFHFGRGTEQILTMLTALPAVHRWYDLGSGSESLLWAAAVNAAHLAAVDADPRRLHILHRFAAARTPRGVHRTALHLCGRTDEQAFTSRCQALGALIHADCLTGGPPAGLLEGSADLVTQFGLLGLCPDEPHFIACFTGLHRLTAEQGWIAGANWVAADNTGRVELSEPLYRHAAAQAGIHLHTLTRTPSTDPEFPAVWMYLGRRTA